MEDLTDSGDETEEKEEGGGDGAYLSRAVWALTLILQS